MVGPNKPIDTNDSVNNQSAKPVNEEAIINPAEEH